MCVVILVIYALYSRRIKAKKLLAAARTLQEDKKICSQDVNQALAKQAGKVLRNLTF